MLHRLLIVSFLMVISTALAASSSPRAVELHRQALAKRDYVKALLVLNKALRMAQNLQPEEEIEILIAKAQFYQRYVADLDSALLTLEEARLKTPVLNPQRMRELDEKIATLKQTILTHREEKAFIDRFAMVSSLEKMAMVEEIEDRMDKAGSASPYSGSLHHCLGVAQLEAKRYRSAYSAFKTATDIAPAIDFNHPTKELREESVKLWKQQWLPFLAKLAVSIFLALIVLGFFATRPFRWLRWGHLLPLPALLVFWAAAHRLLIVLSQSLADATVPKGDRAIVNTHAGAVLSSPLTFHLFIYGAIAVLAIFFASLVISRIALPTTRSIANVCSGFFITGAMMMCFVLAHCQTEVALSKATRFHYMLGSFRYELKDPLPYLLSSPQDFKGLAVERLDEPALREYFRDMEYSDGTDND